MTQAWIYVNTGAPKEEGPPDWLSPLQKKVSEAKSALELAENVRADAIVDHVRASLRAVTPKIDQKTTNPVVLSWTQLGMWHFKEASIWPSADCVRSRAIESFDASGKFRAAFSKVTLQKQYLQDTTAAFHVDILSIDDFYEHTDSTPLLEVVDLEHFHFDFSTANWQQTGETHSVLFLDALIIVPSAYVARGERHRRDEKASL